MKSVQTLAVVFTLSTLLFAASALPARAQYQPAQALVRAVQGSATCSISGNWQPLRADTALTTGAILKTAPDTTLDLFLPESRTVLRLMPDTVLRFDRLDKMSIGEVGTSVTRVSLLSGSIIGSQHKLVRPSEFKVGLRNGMAKIVGTEYSIRSDGTVACLKGTVSVAYNPPGSGSSVNVSVPAGFSSDPATGKTMATSTAYLQHITPDVQAVRNNDMSFNDGRITAVPDHSCDRTSPTHGHHGHHGDDHDHDHGGDHDHGDNGSHGDDHDHGDGGSQGDNHR